MAPKDADEERSWQGLKLPDGSGEGPLVEEASVQEMRQPAGECQVVSRQDMPPARSSGWATASQ